MAVLAEPATPAVDLALMVLAYEILDERAQRARKKVDAFRVAFTTWCEFTDLDESPPDNEADIGEGVVVVEALARRLAALGEMLGRLEPGSYPLDALVEAAATAPVLAPKDRPHFQLLDFVSRVERVAATPEW